MCDETFSLCPEKWTEMNYYYPTDPLLNIDVNCVMMSVKHLELLQVQIQDTMSLSF